MLKYLLFAGVLLLPVSVNAQPVTVEKSVVCDNAQKAIQELEGKHGEKPIWFGEGPTTRYGLLVNPKTSSWSFIQFSAERNIVCLIDSGEGFHINSDIFGKKINL